ncbi:hypothetical protein [Halonatronum saccharophilum]|uniref:hypothetical protein n=1 Tax=Halonatronum saccharophilum TaxID=150060 RepID=UPI000489B22C|nr:hypothetical protein [Halonatronum saccharophilum]
MSKLVEEYILYDLTKKERVVYLAKKDPFLKVDRIAQLAETTAHYVRTVLSEANLSLTKLRREYAKSNGNRSRQNELLLDLFKAEDSGGLKGIVQDSLILNDYSKYQDIVKKKKDSLEKSVLFKEDGLPIMLNTIFLLSKYGVKDFHRFRERRDVKISDLKIRIEEAKNDLTKYLEGSRFLLVLEKDISLSGRLVGQDIIYLNPDKMELILTKSKNKFKVVKCS